MLQSDIVGEKTGWYSLLTRGWFPVVTDIVKAGKPVGRLLIVADIRSFRNQVAQAAIADTVCRICGGRAWGCRRSQAATGNIRAYCLAHPRHDPHPQRAGLFAQG